MKVLSHIFGLFYVNTDTCSKIELLASNHMCTYVHLCALESTRLLEFPNSSNNGLSRLKREPGKARALAKKIFKHD